MKWTRKDISPDEVRTLARRYDIGLLEASILLRRGVNDPEDMLFFLEDDLRFAPNPFLFRAMDDVVDRILGARDDEETVLVFGDRDVDGITSTVLMVEALEELGIKTVWKVPQGDSSYGLSQDAVIELAGLGGGLIVTVDCGISCIKEIELATSLGIDVIVIDHHVPPETVPEAFAVINPKMPGETYPFASLAACAVVSKVVWALRFSQTPLYNQRLCLLHCHQDEGDLIVEAATLTNLVERRRLRLVFGEKSTHNDLEALVRFLQDQEIFVFDEKAQLRHLRMLFGPGVEIGLFDLAPQIRKAFPVLANLPFAEVKAKSRLPRYKAEVGDIDILVSLFTSSVFKAYPTLGNEFVQILDLVAMGTLADLMPLGGENRLLVRLGMHVLNATRRPGLRALLMRIKLLTRSLSTTDVSWYLTPVINASGRLGVPEKAVELFLTKDEARRKTLAQELEGLNQERKQLAQTAWDTVLPASRKSYDALNTRMVSIYDPQVPRGITGILASKLMAFFGVPALVLTSQENKVVGSLRANRGFETRRFLDGFQDLFTDYGGHDQAAGFNMPLEKLSEFQKRLTSVLPGFPLAAEGETTIEIDADLPRDYLKPDLLKVVDLLEPYGEGNRPLVFSCQGLSIMNLDLVGRSGSQHVKMTLDCGALKWPAIYWNSLEKLENKEFGTGDRVSAAFQVNRNYFQGQENYQLTILDLVRSPS